MIKKRIWRFVIGTILGVSLVYTGFALFAARTAVYPWWYKRELVGKRLPECSSYQQRVYVHCADPLKSLALEFTDFKASHLVTLAGGQTKEIGVTGWWIKPKTSALSTVILVHGAGVDRRSMLKHAGYLAAAGFHVLLIDCHNHGLSENDGHGISFGFWESYSIVAAAEWATENIHLPIDVMGTSQGAFAALRAATQTPLIRNIVAENPYLSARRVLIDYPWLKWLPKIAKEEMLGMVSLWLRASIDELDLRRFSAALSGHSVLLIEGGKDTITPPDEAQEIFDLLPEPKEYFLVPEGQHEYVWNVDKTAYEQKVIGFLTRQPSSSLGH
jgi:alpha-beta hydrolase superfamily lysophospholipase